jgi:hypothetical protein
MGELEHLKEWELVVWMVISTNSSTTNPTRTDIGQNPELRDENQATNRLSYGTAYS